MSGPGTSLRTLSEYAGIIAIGARRVAAHPSGLMKARLDPREHQYGGAAFNAASAFLRHTRPGAGAPMRMRHVADPAAIVASGILLSALPRVTISLTDSPSGREIRTRLTERRLGVLTNRIAQGVLPIPGSIEDYLRGRHRQALRTNIRHARALGVHGRRLTEFSERRHFADLLDPNLTDTWTREQMLTRPEAVCWIALDADDRPIGLAVVSVDTDVALLWCLVCHDSPGRWLMHTTIVELLVREGVRHLLVAARMAPLLDPGHQYFQQLLGYRVAHLSLRD